MRKNTFVVGRTTGRSTLLVFITAAKAPIEGPWTVQAVVATN